MKVSLQMMRYNLNTTESYLVYFHPNACFVWSGRDLNVMEGYATVTVNSYFVLHKQVFN